MQIVRPQLIQEHPVYAGTRFGLRHRILVQDPGSRLFQIPGQTVYVDRVVRSRYSRASLLLMRDEMSLSRRNVFELEGVRLSNKLLQSPPVRAAIVAMWGEAVADAVRADATVVLDESESAAAREKSLL